MYDPEWVYTSVNVRDNIYFSAHSDETGLGKVELHIPDEPRTMKLTIAAAEDLLTNLQINLDAARAFVTVNKHLPN